MLQSEINIILEHSRRVCQILKDNIYEKICDLNAKVAVSSEPVAFSRKSELQFKTIKQGERWSSTLFECAWFHITGECDNSSDLYIALDVDGESCLFDAVGTPIRGLTNVSSVFERDLGLPEKIYIPISQCLKDGKIEAWVEAGNNDLFGEKNSGTLLRCDLVKQNKKKSKIYYDFKFLLEFCNSLDEKDILKHRQINALEKASLLINRNMSDRDIESVEKILEPELSRKNIENPLLKMYSVGHSHLDLAWLWPIRETRRKAGRTFATAITNIEKYPDYIYGASQPQQFEWIKEDYPRLYEKIKEAVIKSRIEVQGGMWVEADTNISGGEALIRQFLYGKTFFKNEFGVEIDTLWLPDVFGFSGALPQIMKECGCNNFLTIKLSWNQINKFPYHSFVWKGIDGSSVLVHMPPEGTYNSAASPKSLLEAQRNYQERGICDVAMMLYGIGDGGGGPGEEHLELISRANNVYGLPKIVNATSKEFFKQLSKYESQLATFNGEIYLERHQGTYTSQAKNKKYNRVSENKLSLMESVSSIAIVLKKHTPDKELFDSLWKEVLLYQFHDILPGSSIKRVYDESCDRYKEIIKLSEENTRDTAGKLGQCLCAYNNTSFYRDEYLKFQNNWYSAKVKPYSFGELAIANEELNNSSDNLQLKNDSLKAEFDNTGRLISLFDNKLSKETINEPSNVIELYNDVGDAWDIYINYHKGIKDQIVCSSYKSYKDGPKAGILFEYCFGNSTLSIDAYLMGQNSLLRFDAVCNWQEEDKMLRVSFSPAVITDRASFDIQFGRVTRSISENNSIEAAQFEVCAHKWVDMSEHGFGVTLLNDCKYGHRVKNGIMSINLLRSQNYPCREQDIGSHSFSYGILSHSGNVENVEIQRQAYILNRPLEIMSAKSTNPLFECDNEKAIIESIKPSEDKTGIVARIYNCSAGNIETNIKTNFSYDHIEETNMLENFKNDFHYNLNFKPFEIKTIKFFTNKE